MSTDDKKFNKSDALRQINDLIEEIRRLKNWQPESKNIFKKDKVEQFTFLRKESWYDKYEVAPTLVISNKTLKITSIKAIVDASDNVIPFPKRKK